MKKLLTKEELIAFEDEIANCFNQALIKAPIHLYNGNEDNILKVFEQINEDDWILCSWRSHYQCLLKGGTDGKIEKRYFGWSFNFALL